MASARADIEPAITVELALRHPAGRPMTREEALAMRGAGAIGELPDDPPPAGDPPSAPS